MADYEDRDPELFRAEARDWLEANFPKELAGDTARQTASMMGAKELDTAQTQWKERMGEKGWGVPTWPERYGGRDGDSRPAVAGTLVHTLVQAVAIGLFVLPLSGAWLTGAWVIMLAAVVLTVITGIDYFVSAFRDSRGRPADR